MGWLLGDLGVLGFGLWIFGFLVLDFGLRLDVWGWLLLCLITRDLFGCE